LNLNEFIEKALIDIVEGVEGANEKYKNRFELSGSFHHGKEKHGQIVEFDVSVVIDESSEEGKKSGIGVALVNIGTAQSKDVKRLQNEENAHRLKFKIFINEK
jgi:hypothetical protein